MSAYQPTDEQIEALARDDYRLNSGTDDEARAPQSWIDAERALTASPAFQAIIRAAQAEAWQEGGEHVYLEGGKCSFARDREPCPYNPYREQEPADV